MISRLYHCSYIRFSLNTVYKNKSNSLEEMSNIDRLSLLFYSVIHSHCCLLGSRLGEPFELRLDVEGKLGLFDWIKLFTLFSPLLWEFVNRILLADDNDDDVG